MLDTGDLLHATMVLWAQSTQDTHAQRKQMAPVDVNGSVHTARKQHQRKNVPICVRVASCVLCGLTLLQVKEILSLGNRKRDSHEILFCSGEKNLVVCSAVI